MASDASFIGTTPFNYDRGLGPMFFEPYAVELLNRIRIPDGASVLETAAGTGIVTRHLVAALGPQSRLIASDLNPAMLEIAQSKIPDDPRLEWKVADACGLPFGDNEFDVIVCQFGLMFFPDKVVGLREARRVLKNGGRLLWSTWGSLADNPIAGIAHDVIGSFFPDNPPLFYHTPFGLYDRDKVHQMGTEAGFSEVTAETIRVTGQSESSAHAARGLVLGSPVSGQIQERGTVPHERIVDALSSKLAASGGARPMRLPMLAHIFTARK